MHVCVCVWGGEPVGGEGVGSHGTRSNEVPESDNVFE